MYLTIFSFSLISPSHHYFSFSILLQLRTGTLTTKIGPSLVSTWQSLVTAAECACKSGEWSAALEQLRIVIGHRTGSGCTFPGGERAMTREASSLVCANDQQQYTRLRFG
jgi:hypothetical protein